MKSIEDGNIADIVYCFTEPNQHMGVFNGVVTANCGEQPLPPSGNCNLGAINLTKFIDNPFTDRASIDYNAFKRNYKMCCNSIR